MDQSQVSESQTRIIRGQFDMFFCLFQRFFVLVQQMLTDCLSELQLLSQDLSASIDSASEQLTTTVPKFVCQQRVLLISVFMPFLSSRAVREVGGIKKDILDLHQTLQEIVHEVEEVRLSLLTLIVLVGFLSFCSSSLFCALLQISSQSELSTHVLGSVHVMKSRMEGCAQILSELTNWDQRMAGIELLFTNKDIEKVPRKEQFIITSTLASFPRVRPL